MTAIRGAIVGVPDQALARYKVPGYDAAIRRAVPAIEQLLSDEVAWELFADLGDLHAIEATDRYWRDRFNVPRQRSLL